MSLRTTSNSRPGMPRCKVAGKGPSRSASSRSSTLTLIPRSSVLTRLLMKSISLAVEKIARVVCGWPARERTSKTSPSLTIAKVICPPSDRLTSARLRVRR